VEEGHHARELERLTGLAVQENQARRLLGLIAAYRAHLASTEGVELPLSVAASRWLTERYQPAVEQIPAELRNRLELAEIYHELAEHRYYLAEAAGQEVGNEEALASYLATVLSARPDERTILTDTPAPPP
jgi:Lon protease-like protein